MIMLIMLLSGCGDAYKVSDRGVCEGLQDPLKSLVTVVLLEKSSDAVILAADNYVVKFDAACPEGKGRG
jgi:hypothetical protein